MPGTSTGTLKGRADASGRAYQAQTPVKGKELAHTADVYMKDNPWRSVMAAAGVGLLVGTLVTCK
jgi:ElaB/YqjD/DUF883 family membrane-anchored ribosome-binding protein